MHVEIVEDEVCDPTDKFITRGEKQGTTKRQRNSLWPFKFPQYPLPLPHPIIG